MHTGTVTYWNPHKGFGFVRADNSVDPPCFVHAQALRRAGILDIQVGARLSYGIGPSPTKPERVEAVDIVKLAA